MLEEINSPKDVKKLTLKQKEELAEEIRKYIIEIVAENGGHLASNLGVVELTIALHSIFNVPEDKIVWDVGHQSYVHKIITGRREELKNMRKLNEIAGFPKFDENIADCFNTGHSSTSISAILGMARARDIQGKNNNVIAVIGDGALTGGMALEALNDAGCSKCKMTVVLNDNEMSISHNVGGLNRILGKIRTKKTYSRTNKTFFEDIGFTYFGPIDGHDIGKLENVLEVSKKINGPVLIHVLTKKGKGYKYAEENPDKFHAIAPFNIENGEIKKVKTKDYSRVFGDKIVKLAKENNKIVAVTASMKEGTGLKEFANEFTNRFFDVGIAEQHAITMAAGMAREGMIPFVPIYSTFYQRAYDQVIHDVAMQNLPVIMCVDRAGIVGADGETHQGILDMAFFRLVPNLTIIAPKDFKEFEDMLEFAVNLERPVVIRYPRGSEDNEVKFKEHPQIEYGKAEIVKCSQGNETVTIIAIGKMVAKAVKKAEKLKQCNGIESEIINARFLKPLDTNTILKSIQKTKNVITIEDGTEINGLATAIKELIVDNNLQNIKLKSYAYPDKFIQHGTVQEIESLYGF